VPGNLRPAAIRVLSPKPKLKSFTTLMPFSKSKTPEQRSRVSTDQ